MSALPPSSDHVNGQSDAGASARERLAESRQRISVWLSDDEHGDGNTPNDTTRPRGGTNRVAAIAIDVVSEWWNQHPLHASASLAGAAARGVIVPLVRRHPAVVLGAAAVAGAVLMRSRAWRWLLRPALVAGVASQLASRLLTRAATVQIVNER